MLACLRRLSNTVVHVDMKENFLLSNRLQKTITEDNTSISRERLPTSQAAILRAVFYSCIHIHRQILL